MKYIRKFNSQKLPGAVYIPIDLIGKSSDIKQTVLRHFRDIIQVHADLPAGQNLNIEVLWFKSIYTNVLLLKISDDGC
jgi:hypothetical protein